MIGLAFPVSLGKLTWHPAMNNECIFNSRILNIDSDAAATSERHVTAIDRDEEGLILCSMLWNIMQFARKAEEAALFFAFQSGADRKAMLYTS
jgi:hypothetical protein